jgi:hypothetical protein
MTNTFNIEREVEASNGLTKVIKATVFKAIDLTSAKGAKVTFTVEENKIFTVIPTGEKVELTSAENTQGGVKIMLDGKNAKGVFTGEFAYILPAMLSAAKKDALLSKSHSVMAFQNESDFGKSFTIDNEFFNYYYYA